MPTKQDILDWFPAAKEALEGGGTWSHHPETLDALEWTPYYCDDCDAWHHQWSGEGFGLEGGVFFHELHVYDDADWDILDSRSLDADDYKEWAAALVEQSCDCRIDYYKWVVENNSDPLDHFFPSERLLTKRAQDALDLERKLKEERCGPKKSA
jgi:hypothetical protein